jgi:O-acetyl-ADP-ribose deacetylase (regulator of RNase III)
MNRLENIDRAIRLLAAETGQQIPADCETLPEKQRLLRALMNVRPPLKPSEELLEAQDRELQLQLRDKGVVTVEGEGLKLWQGDITRLQVDAIVNAANSRMLGCFVPLHGCIDNAIHSAAGIQLRCACYDIMEHQHHEEPAGQAKITPAFNLPARYVIHTVGPIVPDGVPTREQAAQLAGCYRSCLDVAEQKGLQSIAFCCISTGVFRYPRQQAARIAVETVRAYPRTHIKTVVFDVFSDTDYDIYRKLL